ncbi:metal cation transporter, ZIP family [Ancylostoma duodenale]|nr:metal cation transporter, ZIP family [Ancylostoma duodenale]
MYLYILLQDIRKKSETSDIEMMKLETNAGKSMGDQAHGICVHDHSVDFRVGDSPIAAVAWMIIFGDGFHNFIDGISIGASFAESLHAGLSVSLAVLAEEFPHELGDVAILVASGMTLRQALLYNLLSAITCYVGFVIGVGIGELGPDVSKYAFALAGGMFLYISLGCMMPEMKKAMEEALNVSMKRGIHVLFLQSIGLFTGLFLMYFMARYGEEISI